MTKHVILVCEGKKPLKCDICDAKFVHKQGMEKHIATIHEGKKFANVAFMMLSLVKRDFESIAEKRL